MSDITIDPQSFSSLLSDTPLLRHLLPSIEPNDLHKLNEPTDIKAAAAACNSSEVPQTFYSYNINGSQFYKSCQTNKRALNPSFKPIRDIFLRTGMSNTYKLSLNRAFGLGCIEKCIINPYDRRITKYKRVRLWKNVQISHANLYNGEEIFHQRFYTRTVQNAQYHGIHYTFNVVTPYLGKSIDETISSPESQYFLAILSRFKVTDRNLLPLLPPFGVEFLPEFGSVDATGKPVLTEKIVLGNYGRGATETAPAALNSLSMSLNALTGGPVAVHNGVNGHSNSNITEPKPKTINFFEIGAGITTNGNNTNGSSSDDPKPGAGSFFENLGLDSPGLVINSEEEESEALTPKSTEDIIKDCFSKVFEKRKLQIVDEEEEHQSNNQHGKRIKIEPQGTAGAEANADANASAPGPSAFDKCVSGSPAQVVAPSQPLMVSSDRLESLPSSKKSSPSSCALDDEKTLLIRELRLKLAESQKLLRLTEEDLLKERIENQRLRKRLE